MSQSSAPSTDDPTARIPLGGLEATGAGTALNVWDVAMGGALGAAFRSRSGMPVINVAGCPTHPNWVTETLMLLAAGSLGESALDPFARPRFYAEHLVHHGCSKNEFYEYKASALALSAIAAIGRAAGRSSRDQTSQESGCASRSRSGTWSSTSAGMSPGAASVDSTTTVSRSPAGSAARTVATVLGWLMTAAAPTSSNCSLSARGGSVGLVGVTTPPASSTPK